MIVGNYCPTSRFNSQKRDKDARSGPKIEHPKYAF